MKRIILYLILLTTSTTLFAQKKVVGQVDSLNTKTIHVKWYFPELVNSEGYNIYRRNTNSIAWQKLNSTPILYKVYEPTKSDYLIDKELKNYLDLSSNPKNLKDLALLAVILKSFRSAALCKYLGIWFDDEISELEKNYSYKVCLIKQNNEVDSAFSDVILAGKYNRINAPKEIQFKTGNKKTSFAWLPETDRYYATNIYRKLEGDSSFKRITNNPIIVSKTKNKAGEEVYGEEFFVDTKLKPHITYTYYLEALDFFGNPSTKSELIKVKLKDFDPPKSPDSLFSKVDGRKVKINWNKKIIENDLVGYNVYRTTYNDTDFVKLNDNPILKAETCFIDSVNDFGSYMYAVSSIDEDLNEQRSNPFFVEVYDNEAPRPPKNIKILSDSGKIKLSWDKNSERDLKGYLVYRTVNSDLEEAFVKLNPRPILENQYEDELPKNIKNKFFYKIVAIDQSMNRSAYSDIASATMPDLIAPQAPFLISVTKNKKNNMLLNWLANAEPDLAGYTMYRSRIDDSSFVFEKLNTTAISTKLKYYTDHSIRTTGTYVYKMKAADSSGNHSSFSNEIKIKYKIKSEETEIAFTKLKVSYNSKKQQAELQWKLQDDKALRTCIIYKRKLNESVFKPCSGNLKEMSFTDSDLSKGVAYFYQVRAYNTKGDVFKSESKLIQTQ